ncbi:hypothetical protein [Bradyrhizobium sp.]|uniref:hypothetical protein n=1 Tax=Bradyrhizobium sp. TaxID=376 RepID=UPI0025C352EC|nr:hypothetical protein [Bradyrhizobium sp.]
MTRDEPTAASDNKENAARDEGDDPLPPLLEVTGLIVDIWPAWAPFPSQNIFVPYFSANVSDEDKKHSFVTTLSLPDLVFTCSQVAHVLKISCKSAEGLGTAKMGLFSEKAVLVSEIDDIVSDLGALRKMLVETDVVKEIDIEGDEDDGAQGASED